MVWSSEIQRIQLVFQLESDQSHSFQLADRFFEYLIMVPANKIGFEGNGGPFSLWQLKVIQEVITLSVFTGFTLIVFKGEVLRTNHIIGFVFLVLAVYFIFKK